MTPLGEDSGSLSLVSPRLHPIHLCPLLILLYVLCCNKPQPWIPLMLTPMSPPNRILNLGVVLGTPDTVAKCPTKVLVLSFHSNSNCSRRSFTEVPVKVLGLPSLVAMDSASGIPPRWTSHQILGDDCSPTARQDRVMPLSLQPGTGSPTVTHAENQSRQGETSCWCWWKLGMDAEQLRQNVYHSGAQMQCIMRKHLL